MGWSLPGGKLCCDSLMWNDHTALAASRLPPGKLQRDREGLNQRSLDPDETGPFRMGVFPHAGEAVSGCVIQGEGCTPSAMGSVVYLNGTDDLSEPLARVEKSGGKVAVPKTKISDEIGYFAQFLDTEGNRVGLYSRH